MVLVGSAVLVMTGCGDSSASFKLDDGDKNDTVPPVSKKDMTAAQAKDAMALDAAIYPILAPISELSNCLTSTDALKTCIKDAIGGEDTVETSTIDPKLDPGTYECTAGHPEYGHFTYAQAGDTVKYTFDNCKDYSNQKDLYTNLIVKSCLLGLNPRVNMDAPSSIGTYRIEHTGSVECSSGKKSADYTYRTIGNSNGQDKQQWTYKGTVEFGDGKVIADGSVRGIHKYAVGSDTPDTPWDELFLGSDEEWQFANAGITLGNPIVLNGKSTYVKHPNDNEGEKGEGYEFYMAFESLAYDFLKSGRDITSNVTGKASASCHPEFVTYATTADMVDVESLRDATFHRMPSSGEMTTALDGYNPVPVKFSASGSNAQVTVETTDGKVTFDSWKAIIDGSSCTNMNDFLGNLPQPPVKNPTPGEILPENIAFATNVVLSPDKQSVTGETDGRAVWYHLKRDQGYTDGQTVAGTDFQFVATGPSGVGVFVNVYLYDENGDAQRISIYSNSDWSALQADPVKGKWTLRTDYMEGDILDGVLYQGNFILRIGDSSYSGSGEAFSITKYLVQPAAH